MDIVEEKIVFQVFVTVKDNGELSTCEVGVPAVRNEPADFFFIVDEDLANDLKENANNYKVVLNGMKPKLVTITQTVEEGTLPEN
ncbi:hypothetical protein ACXKZH_07225 [Priestia megaterium]